jgi:hypothetical protein
MAVEGTPIPADELIRDLPQRNAGVNWSIAVDHYLDQLLTTVTSAGDRSTRKELVAAIVSAFDNDPAEIGRVLRSYRTRTVGDLLGRPGEETSTPSLDEVIRFRKHPPGPRRHDRLRNSDG